MAKNQKSPARNNRKAQKSQPSGIKKWYRETVGELRKVSWPTRKEAVGLTKVVVVVMILMGILLGGVDIIFTMFFDLILG